MLIRNLSVDDFAEYEKDCGKKIILFGTGVIASISASYEINRNNLLGNILFAVDNDRTKWGKAFEIAGERIPIFPVEKLHEVKNRDDIIILITGSHFCGMLGQLEQMELEKAECFILPIMYVSHLKEKNKGAIKETKNMIIPKKIHYMWFGKKEMSPILKKCIRSWETMCPDYEIICWNENNYDLDKHPYMRQAYEHKQWGFIPDYARLDLLYQYGGIYMDTDIELIRPLDEMLYQEAFTSVEKWNVINIGGCTGAVAHHGAIKKILDERENVFFEIEGKLNKTASGFYDTLPFIREGLKLDGTNQKVAGMNIYASDYFHPYDYMSGETTITGNTFSIHHFNGGWLDEATILQRETTKKKYQEIVKMEKWSDTNETGESDQHCSARI